MWISDQWHYSIDGGKCGPVSAQELKKLAENGLLRPTDLVWKEGMAKWRPAGEIKGLFATVRGSAKYSPPRKAIPNQAETWISATAATHESISPSPTTRKPTTSGLAIASLCTGIPGVCCFPAGVVAIVLGFVALNEIKTSEDSRTGKEMAIGGVTLGAISILITIIALFANPDNLSPSPATTPAKAPANPAPLQTSDSISDRYSNREIEEAKAALRREGLGNPDPEVVEAVLDLKSIMEAEEAGRL